MVDAVETCIICEAPAYSGVTFTGHRICENCLSRIEVADPASFEYSLIMQKIGQMWRDLGIPTECQYGEE